MIRKSIKAIVLLALLVFISCDKDTTTPSETASTTHFTNIENAVSDGVGTFNVKLSNSEYKLSLHFTSVPSTDGELATGTYPITREKNKEYSVLSEKSATYWIENSNNTSHIIASGVVTVITQNGKSTLAGNLKDIDGNTLSFNTTDISFALLPAEEIKFTHILQAGYALRHGNGLYRVVLANSEMTKAVSLDFYNGPTENPNKPELPSGHYHGATSGIVEGVYLNTSYWFDAANNKRHDLSGASCTVDNAVGSTIIEGMLTDTDNKSVRFSFIGKLKFNESDEKNLDIFTYMSTKWTMNAERWRTYDRTVSQWVINDFPDNVTSREMSWIGIPDFDMFYASGLWSSLFSGMFIEINNGEFSIPVSYEKNIIFIATAGGQDYYIFPTLYDPAVGYLLVGGSIGLHLSEDQNTLTVRKAVGTAPDGRAINYEFFGIAGRNASTGGLTFFTNWSQAYLPTFNRSEASMNTRSSINADILKFQKETHSTLNTDKEMIGVKTDDIPTIEAESVRAYIIK